MSLTFFKHQANVGLLFFSGSSQLLLPSPPPPSIIYHVSQTFLLVPSPYSRVGRVYECKHVKCVQFYMLNILNQFSLFSLEMGESFPAVECNTLRRNYDY